MNVFTKKFIFALIAFFSPFISFAQTVDVDGLTFVVDSENSEAFLKFVGDNPTGGSYSGDIVIPSSVEYDGQIYSVIGIYPYTFYRCQDLTSVTIPETVTFIGDYAFMECTSLTSIDLPDAVVYFGAEVLRGCTMLESAILPATLKEIPVNAFYDCSSLQSIDIPDSVESIGNDAFYQCYSLESVKMGASVTSIGTEAFSWCPNLKSVYTPSLEAWCNIQFSNYNSTPLYYGGDLYVNGVLLENLVEFPSFLPGVGDYSFYGCGSLKSVTIPEGHTSIGFASFSACNNLETIIIPSSVTNIGAEAFCYSGLKSIVIPASVSSIGDYSLTGCDKLESIVISPENTVYDSRDNCNALIETATNTLLCGCNTTVIPNTVTALADYSFFYSGLTSIDIPESIVSIPEAAFSHCSNLESVSIGSSVTSIDRTAFLYTYLKSITVDSENTVYDSRDNCNAIIISETNELFLGCETTVIPTTATSIIYPGFAENQGLTSVVIPGNITKIGAETFKRCFNVKSVEVENGVVTIEDGAFFANNTLESVILPASLNYIGRMAFGMIQTIQYIRCDAVTPPELGDVVFYWTDTNTCVLEVPDESVEAYKAAAQWGDFINTTGVAKVLRDENSIIVESGNIHNADNANIEVYTISGAKIYSGKDSRVTLPSGLYIIKSDDKAMKVAL